MARHNLPSFDRIWDRHERRYVKVFSLALQQLSASLCSEKCGENAISERLCPILSAVCFEESRRTDTEVPTPQWERPIQPVTTSELRGGKAGMRPDFTCTITNPLADSPCDHEIALHIECKLLGTPTSDRWILNENYVLDGIGRFDSSQHEYGKRAHSGMMVGYVVSMSPPLILKEVNAYQKQHYPHNQAIELELELVRGDVLQHRQRLTRRVVEPAEFRLVHLWVDLRADRGS